MRVPGTFMSPALLLPVLLVADLFQPVHVLATSRSCQGDVRHGGGRRRAVPVLDARRTPDDVAGANSVTGPPHSCVQPTPEVTIRC